MVPNFYDIVAVSNTFNLLNFQKPMMNFETDKDHEKVELEEQFILRLPYEEALKLRNLLDSKPSKVKKTLKLDLNLKDNTGIVKFGKRKLYGCLKNLPTIMESYKTYDKVVIGKTADVHEILICDYQKNCNKKLDFMHGITPPLKNVKKKRFRKTLINTDRAVEVENIERELYYLLRTDLEAISSKYEITFEHDKENYLNNRVPSVRKNTNGFNEQKLSKKLHLFGNISSEMSDEEN